MVFLWDKRRTISTPSVLQPIVLIFLERKEVGVIWRLSYKSAHTSSWMTLTLVTARTGQWEQVCICLCSCSCRINLRTRELPHKCHISLPNLASAPACCFIFPETAQLSITTLNMQNGEQNQEAVGLLKNILRYRISLAEDYYWFAHGAVSLCSATRSKVTDRDGVGWPSANQKELLCRMGWEDGGRLREW